VAASVQAPKDAILLDVVLKALIKREENRSVFGKRLIRNSLDIRGKKIISKTEIQGEEGFGARGRGGAYPHAQEFGTLDAEALLKRNYGSLECYGEDRILSARPKTDEAVVSIIVHKGKSFSENFAVDMERQYWGTGSGEMGKVSTTESSVNIVKVNKTQYFRRNMYIDIHEGTVVENRSITAVSKKNKTITVDGAAFNVTAGSIITRADSKDLEILGLPIMVDDGVYIAGANEYENIKRDEFEEWQALVMDGKGDPFDLTVLDELMVRGIHDYDADYSAAYMDWKTLLSIMYLLKKKGITMNTIKLELGYEAPVYITPKGPIPLIVDKNAPEHSIWPLTESVISLRRPNSPEFIPGTNGYWSPHPDKDMDFAHMRYLAEMFCLEPWKNAKYVNYVSAVGT